MNGLARLWQALRPRPLAWPHLRSGLLGPCPTPVLRHGRSGRERPSQSSGQDAGRICLSNNVAERGVRGIALGPKSWLFCSSDRGGQRAAVMHGLIVTAKMNDIDPQAWHADVLARIAEHSIQRLDDLLLWNWTPPNAQACQAA